MREAGIKSEAGGALFEDGKAPDAMRTIGEVARALGIRQHVLRYWEQQFPMLSPLKRSGGRRYYRTEDIALIERIDRLVNREGYTLKGARAVIEAGEEEPQTPASELPRAEIDTDELLPKLRAVRSRLAGALERV